MIPVKQSTTGGASSPPERRGDCLSACFASILEVPLSYVPRWCELPEESDWELAVNEWLRGFGLSYLIINHDEDPEGYYARIAPTIGWHILCGYTNTGTAHATVGFGGKFVFDPFPSLSRGATLLIDPNDEYPWTLGLILASKPERIRRMYG